MNKSDFLLLRTVILDEFINLETMINLTISYKFFNKYSREFVFPVLHSPHFSFALRVDILKKIMPNFDEDIFSKLNRMGKYRNLFAHTSPNYFDNHQGAITYDDVGWFPNPENLSEKLDFEKTAKTFMELRDIVLPYIVTKAKEIGVPF